LRYWVDTYYQEIPKQTETKKLIKNQKKSGNKMINKKDSCRYTVSNESISYGDVITYNNKQIEDMKKRDKISLSVGMYHLEQNNDNKIEKFYGDKSLILDSKLEFGRNKGKYGGTGLNFDEFLLRRYLYKNNINEKDYVVIRLEQDLVETYLESIDFVNDSYFFEVGLWNKYSNFIGDIEQTLPNGFNEGFYDTLDGHTYYIVPSDNVPYDENFGLLRNIRCIQTGDESFGYQDEDVQYHNSFQPVEVPSSVIVHHSDTRVMKKLVDEKVNGVEEVSIPIQEMYDRVLEDVNNELDEKTKNLELVGDSNNKNISDQIKGFINDSYGSTNSIKVGNFDFEKKMKNEPNKVKGYEYTFLPYEDSETIGSYNDVSDILDKVEQRKEKTLTDLQEWKSKTNNHLDELISTLQEKRNLIDKESKDFEEVLNEPIQNNYDLDFFKDDVLENVIPIRIEHTYGFEYNKSFEDSIKHLLIGYGGKYSKGSGILNSLDIKTLKKLRTNGSTFVKGFLEGNQINDLSKNRNSGKNIVEIPSIPNIVLEKTIDSYFGFNDKVNENNQYELVINGTNSMKVLCTREIVMGLIYDLMDFQTRYPKNKSLWKSEVSNLKKNFLDESVVTSKISIPKTLSEDDKNLQNNLDLISKSLETDFCEKDDYKSYFKSFTLLDIDYSTLPKMEEVVKI